jgi:hypothetical protein
MSRIARGVVALAALLAIGAGCGGQADEAEGWSRLLAAVPDTPSTRASVLVNDHLAAQDARELAPDDEPIIAGSALSGARSPQHTERWRAALGFDVDDVELDVEAGLPPERYEAVRGRFDAAAIDTAVRSDPDWSQDLETDTHRGVTIYRWGADHEVQLARRDEVRPLGQSARLALVDDTILWASWTAGVEEMIAAVQGEQRSLADVAELDRSARALDELGAFSAFLSADTAAYTLDRALLERLTSPSSDEPDDPPTLAGYAGLATGVGVDEDGWFQVIVLSHAEQLQAQRNADRFEIVLAEGASHVTGEPWREIIAEWTITVDGELTVVALRTDRRRLWFDVAMRPDLVLWR